MAMEAGKQVLKASLILGSENRTFSPPSGGEKILLSERLVELKSQCMEFLVDYMLRHNEPQDALDDEEILGEEMDNDDDEEDAVDEVSKKRK